MVRRRLVRVLGSALLLAHWPAVLSQQGAGQWAARGRGGIGRAGTVSTAQPRPSPRPTGRPSALVALCEELSCIESVTSWSVGCALPEQQQQRLRI